MASGLSCVVVLALCVTLAPCVSAGDRDCEGYTDLSDKYHSFQRCYVGYCCGSCYNRYCCQNSFMRLSEDKQDDCNSQISYPDHMSYSSTVPMVLGIGSCVTILLIFCCCCYCCKICRKPRPVIATTTHTTVVTTTPQQYPQQPTATPGQPLSYQGAQYPHYQPVPVQPGYGAQPMPQAYGAQPMPTSAGPPPTYQEAIGPAYPPNPMPYSQAAFNPGQPAYPLQPPVQPQPNAPYAHTDYLAQPAFNPDYVAPPPKTG